MQVCNQLTQVTRKSNRIRWVILCCAMILSLAFFAQPLTAQATDDSELGIYGVWLDWTKFESGSESYNSTGGNGGISYGRFQFTAGYCLEDFVQYCQTSNPDHYNILDLGNLDVTWQQAYADYDIEFALLQDSYAMTHYYATIHKGLQDLYGISLVDYSEVLRGTALSIAIRDGRHVSLESNTNNLRAVTDTYYPGIDEAEWLSAIYDAEADRHPSQDWRWRDEQKTMALEALNSI